MALEFVLVASGSKVNAFSFEFQQSCCKMTINAINMSYKHI